MICLKCVFEWHLLFSSYRFGGKMFVWMQSPNWLAHMQTMHANEVRERERERDAPVYSRSFARIVRRVHTLLCHGILHYDNVALSLSAEIYFVLETFGHHVYICRIRAPHVAGSIPNFSQISQQSSVGCTFTFSNRPYSFHWCVCVRVRACERCTSHFHRCFPHQVQCTSALLSFQFVCTELIYLNI